MDRVAPKDAIKDAKASQKDNSQDSNDKPDDKSAVDAGTQQDANVPQNVSQSSAKPAAPAKAGKSDDDKKDVLTKADEEASEENQIAATTLELLSLQNVPAATQPAVQAPVAAPGTGGDLTVDSTAPAAQTTAPVQPGASAANTPAGASQPAAAQDDQQDDETVAAGSQAQTQAPQSLAQQPDIQPAQPGKEIAKPQAVAAKPDSNPAPQATADDTVTQEDIVAAAADAPKDNAPSKPATGKSDAIKTAAPKADFGKSRFAQDTKTDTNKGDADKVAQLATAAPQIDADEISEPPKPAPQPVQPLNSNPLLNPNTPAGNVPANPIAVAHVTQHIQVTATPAPNLPALAVEIAAKSQSGAKQFDIRLDPPELGRVEVRLSIDATGKASAHLSADQPQTLNLLQKDASVLTRALRDAGLDVSQDGLNFSLRQQSDNNNQTAGNNSRRSRSFSLSATTGIDASPVTAAYRGVANGRLDIRV